MRGVTLKQCGGVEQLIFSSAMKLKIQISTSTTNQQAENSTTIIINEELNSQQDLSTILSTQILIRVKACAISELDIHARQGKFAFLTRLNYVSLGYEVAGIIEKVGNDVNGFAVGDAVVGFLPLDIEWGGYAELCLAEAHYFVHIPKNVAFDKAAGGVLAGLRCFNAFHYQHRLEKGDTVLIIQGAKGTNHLAVQYASQRGAKVITTVTTDEELNYLQDLHTEVHRIIDLRREQVHASVMEETGGLGVDVVLDYDVIDLEDEEGNIIASTSSSSPAGLSFNDCLAFMAPNSKFLTPNQQLTFTAAQCKQMFMKGIAVAYLNEQSYVLSCSQQGRHLHMLRQVVKDIAKEKLKVKVEQTFSLEKARDAHRKLLSSVSSPFCGKIVIKL